MVIDKHHSDLKEAVNLLHTEIEEEKAAHQDWGLHRTEIDSQLSELQKGPLAGVRINGQRPTERPLEDEPDLASTATQDVFDPGNGLHFDPTSTSLRMLNELEDFNLEVLDEYFASSGAGSDPYTTLFPEGEVPGLPRDSIGSITETDTGVENHGFEYFQQPNSPFFLPLSHHPLRLTLSMMNQFPWTKTTTYIAPRDFNLNLDECNVLPGNSKRQCIRSSCAADADSAAALRPAKQGQLASIAETSAQHAPISFPSKPSGNESHFLMDKNAIQPASVRLDDSHSHYLILYILALRGPQLGCSKWRSLRSGVWRKSHVRPEAAKMQ
ncbi:hypothetical protein K438DRAFT_1773514 [Mycena galopus ATCC 62051]|nr:hypothetical protein K438DRAFT_1773514 [Mycena galopus ATCC 62051]